MSISNYLINLDKSMRDVILKMNTNKKQKKKIINEIIIDILKELAISLSLSTVDRRIKMDEPASDKTVEIDITKL